eukprot:g4107.t1
MAVDVLALVALIFQAGSGVIEQCEIAQQCAGEAARIALRTQNMLGLLQVGEEELLSNVPFEYSLLFLRETLETISVLLERCKQPARPRASRAFRMKATKAALLAAEANLERVTNDLKLPVLADIELLLNESVAQSRANAAQHSSAALSAIAATANAAGRYHEVSSNTLEYHPDEEYTNEEARGVIEQGMRARTNGGALVEDVIQDELAKSGSSFSINLATFSESGNNEGDHLALNRVVFDGLLEERLGQGTFGVVLAGRYKNRNVAVKIARGPISDIQTLQDLRKEAEIQYVLRHANIVETIAFSMGNAVTPPCLIMERMHESLFARLKSKIDFPVALGIILDVCKALRFLHGYKIVHKNIKSPNVLLDRRGKAKLSDFSLADISATINGDTGGGFHSNISSQFWMAPEINSHKKASARSDIFSLHVVMWEAISNQRAGNGTPIGIMLLGDPGAKLSLVGTSSAPAPLLRRMQHLLDWCGSFHSQDRPTITEITPEVEALHAEASRGGTHQETPKAGLWSPVWFSMNQLHDSGTTVAAQSPLGYQPHYDERLSASEMTGVVGGVEDIAAEEATASAVPVAAIAAPAAAKSTFGRGNRPESFEGTPKAVPWSPMWLWDGKLTLGTAETQPSDDNSDEAIGGGGEEKVGLGAETARLGVTTAVAPAAAAKTARPLSWKPDSAYSIMTTSDSGFQRRYVVAKSDEESLSEHKRDVSRLFVAGVAGEARDSDDRTEEYNTVETLLEDDNDGATIRSHCKRGQGQEGVAVTAAAAGRQEQAERRIGPRANGAREREGDGLVMEVTCDKQALASEIEQEHARGGILNAGGDEEDEEDEDEDEEDEEGEDGEKNEEGEEGEEDDEGGEDEEGDEHAQDSGLDSGPALSMKASSAKEMSRRRQRHDRSVLMVLFERCRGSQWTFRDNWGSAEPLSAWSKVTVDAAGHVATLVLSRNKLSGELPAELGMLAFLRELRLRRNHLQGRILPCIGGLSSLLILDLHGNRLCGCIPKEIGKLDRLENLFLGNNNFSGPIPAEIGQLRNLRAVSLMRNQFTGDIPPQLGKLGALQSLELARNKFEGPIPAELGDLRALTELTMGGNRLTGAIPPELGRLSRLVVLDLHGNRLSGNIPSAVRNLTQENLLHLELAGNELADDTLAPGVSG